MSELRNLTATRWDWDKMLKPLGNPFPRGISCADVDSETEIRGRFLVLEGKRTFEQILGGQKYTMDARVRDGRTCFIVYGVPEKGIITEMLHWGHGKRQPATVETLHEWIRRWAEWADSQPPPPTRKSEFQIGEKE
jgi:hypothetical protein